MAVIPTFWIPIDRCTLHNFAAIRQNPEERHEDLYQCLKVFVEDNLLRQDGGVCHHNQVITEDVLSPSLENFVVLIWLRPVHSELPKLVTQRHGTETQVLHLSLHKAGYIPGT